MDIRLRTSRFCSKSRGLPLRLAASRSYEEGGVSSGPMDPSAAHQLAQSILFLSEINVLFGLYWYFNFLGGKSPLDKEMRAINYIPILPSVPFQMQGGATPKAPVCGPMTQMRYEALTAGPMPRLAERAADEDKPYG